MKPFWTIVQRTREVRTTKAYITQIRLGQNKTKKSEGTNQKAERELTVSFPFGELDTTDTASLNKVIKDMSNLVDASIDEALKGMENTPSAPESFPQDSKKGATKPPPKLSDEAKAMGWKETVMCGKCGATVQVQIGRESGKPWAKHCGHWLNSDGSLGDVLPASMR